LRAAVLTVSDRSAKGEREDSSGPALRALLEAHGWSIRDAAIVPDEPALIREKLIEWADSGEVDLILTTGGTGLGPRDRTPEATIEILEREAPGLAEAIRAAGLPQTPHAMLSRGVAGTRGKSLIVNLAGSPKAAREGLEVILPALPHAIALLSGKPEGEAGHRPPPSLRKA
jgi:molybdenum cofactor synthesis domain-containing protein